MIDRNLNAVPELSELSVVEMEQVQGGGDVVPTDTPSFNFSAIKFEYKPDRQDKTLLGRC